jgi:hypothetical protein
VLASSYPHHSQIFDNAPSLQPYVVLPKADLLVRQQETIAKTTSILGISDEDAARVLRKFKW